MLVILMRSPLLSFTFADHLCLHVFAVKNFHVRTFNPELGVPACLCLCARRSRARVLPCLRACLLACVPACLRACVPVCLRACVCPCLRACVPACLLACLPACLRSCVPACQCACVPPCLCVRLFVCLRECMHFGVWMRVRVCTCARVSFSPFRQCSVSASRGRLLVTENQRLQSNRSMKNFICRLMA